MSALLITAPADDFLARCTACAKGYRAIGRDFSAATVTGFARDIEGGMPWHLYAHWLNEAEARLERLSA